MEKNGMNTRHNLTIRLMRLSDINEAFYNPRKDMKKGTRQYENLKRSLTEFGDVEPLVVNEVNNRLIGGHQRLRIYKDLGMEHVEVSIVHIENESEEKALNVALNKIEGKWDRSKLSAVIKDIEGEYDAMDLGFDESEIIEFLSNGDDLSQESVTGADVDNMDGKISLKKEPAASIVAIAGVRFPIPADEFSAIEQGIIEQGYFTDKEIGEVLKQRLNGNI